MCESAQSFLQTALPKELKTALWAVPEGLHQQCRVQGIKIPDKYRFHLLFFSSKPLFFLVFV
jgi:hypothetical protein